MSRFGLWVVCIVPVAFPALAGYGPYPNDANIVDVSKPPYNAAGDGQTDDTKALQQALLDHPSQNKIIYLPAGTYLISDTLRWSAGAHAGVAQKRTILEGEGPDKTVIKLQNNCPGYTEPNNGKAVIWTGEKPAQRFRNAIRDLTVDVGTGNAGAIGVQFIANNQGCMRNVTIRSGDGKGLIGLDLSYTDEVGPCLIKNLRVVGFDGGIKIAHAVDSVTFEHVILENQNRYGLYNDGQCVSIRGLRSISGVSAVQNLGPVGVMTLIDGELTGVGDAAQSPAVVNEAVLFARNLRATGYRQAIENKGGHRQGVDGPQVQEFASHPVLKLYDSPERSLGLPIKETPDVAWDGLDQWASPTHFGATPDDQADDTEAIQKAIDSGKTTVYLPNGRYVINGIVHIRGAVRRLVGLEARLAGEGVLRLEHGAAQVVVLERLDMTYSKLKLEHASSRTWVIASSMVGSYSNTGTGELFIEDVCGGPWTFTRQNVWARQINAEQPETKITNDGGNLWVLGLKTERGGTLIETRSGGRTELLGGFAYATSGPKEMPMFINDESSVSLTIGESCFNNNPFMVLVRETRDGVTKELKRGETPGRTGGSVLPLYVGYRNP